MVITKTYGMAHFEIFQEICIGSYPGHVVLLKKGIVTIPILISYLTAFSQSLKNNIYVENKLILLQASSGHGL